MTDPLMLLLRLAQPFRARLLLAVVAGAAAAGCGVALLAVSGYLLARASQHPSIVAITAAIVAVRAFSVGRGVFRYAERLTSHDAAFRILADARVAIYQRLERLAPAGLRSFRSGELVARFVSDVDATQDRCQPGGEAARRCRPARQPGQQRVGSVHRRQAGPLGAERVQVGRTAEHVREAGR